MVQIIRAKDFEDMSRKAANIIAAQVVLKPESVLGLATGSTPVGLYSRLIEMYKAGDVSFRNVHTVNLDEYEGLDARSDQSYVWFMHHNLFDSVDVKSENINLPNGAAADGEAECKRYEEVVRGFGYADLQLLGIGHNGHIGFNEPCGEFPQETHRVELTESTIRANSRFFADGEHVPTHAYTMGIGTIMNAKKVLLVASGKDKADIVYRSFFGPVTPQVPASILQFHPDVTVVADEAALALVK
ncbi:MAG: glucosamine-6-phosphate deaminase [Clostridia bacterium]|nr:glucosamine-6-phosphate deaminase [Clostridia bacterium]